MQRGGNLTSDGSGPRPHWPTVAALLADLGADAEAGLPSPAAVRASRDRHGSNARPARPPLAAAAALRTALADPTLGVLVAAGAASLLLERDDGGSLDGAAVLAAVAVCASVSAGAALRGDAAFRELEAAARAGLGEARVARGGHRAPVLRLPPEDVVVGDVCRLSAGDVVPADAVVVTTTGGGPLGVDESALSGEAHEVLRPPAEADSPPAATSVVFSGSTVVSGEGSAVVVAVGPRSRAGSIAAATMAAADEAATGARGAGSLEERLGRAAAALGGVGAAAALAVFAVGAARALDDSAALVPPGSPALDVMGAAAPDLAAAATVALSVLVAAVPEGLPVAAALALAYSARTMGDRHGVLVRRPGAVEALGRVTLLLSDKTGTLTAGRQVAARRWEGVDLAIEGSGPLMPAPHKLRELSAGPGGLLIRAVALCSSVEVTIPRNGQTPRLAGPNTELALCRIDIGGDGDEDAVEAEAVARFVAARAGWRISDAAPFSSDAKTMGVVVAPEDESSSDPGGTLILKGSPEAVLARCASVLVSDVTTALTIDGRRRLLASADASGLRVLAVAAGPGGLDADGLTLVALVGLDDPLRPDAAEAVARCRAAGVGVRVLTGDAVAAGVAAASSAGIVDHDDGLPPPCTARDLIVELKGLDPDEAARQWTERGPRVVARCSPEDKLYLVDLATRGGAVVAVTGDGTNDAPALRRSSIGLALASGTAVARAAADVVLLDGGLHGIADGIRLGRHVREQASRFLGFQFTTTLSALATCVVAPAFLGGRAVFSAPQMLWINLWRAFFFARERLPRTTGPTFPLPTPSLPLRPHSRSMDSLASLALAAAEPPVDEPIAPVPPVADDPLLPPAGVRAVVAVSAYQLAAVGAFIVRPDVVVDAPLGSPKHLTAVFTLFSLLQVVNQVGAAGAGADGGAAGGLSRWLGRVASPGLFAVVALEALGQWLIVAFGGEAMDTVPMDSTTWLACWGVALGSLVVRGCVAELGGGGGPASTP